MKVRLYSDIHLDPYAAALHQTRVYDPNDKTEFDPFWYPKELPDDKDTVLIIAGDLWTGTKWIEYAGHSWLGKVAPRFKQVLVVLGNHDYWPTNHHLNIIGGGDVCNAMLQDFGYDNVKVLDMDTYTEGDYIFVGATLWTDMFKADPLAMQNLRATMYQDGNIAYEIDGKFFERFTSQKWINTHYKHRDYIKLIASQNRDKKIFVITHHLPLHHVGDPFYKGNELNAYYSSDLSDLILDNENITHWVHGHSHHQHETQFEHCLVINNALGYQGEHSEQNGAVKHKVYKI